MVDGVTTLDPRGWVELLHRASARREQMLENQSESRDALRVLANDFLIRSKAAGVRLEALFGADAGETTQNFNHWLVSSDTSEETLFQKLTHGLGSWIGEVLIEQLGGEWVVIEGDRFASRVGFAEVFLEAAPFSLAAALVRRKHDAGEALRSQIESIHARHGRGHSSVHGSPRGPFSLRTYVRLHTMPLVQWMAIDLSRSLQAWNETPVHELLSMAKNTVSSHQRHAGEQLLAAMPDVKLDQPVRTQTKHVVAFEAVASLVGVGYWTRPVAVDQTERLVVPAMRLDAASTLRPLTDAGLANLNQDKELFTVFVDSQVASIGERPSGVLGGFPLDMVTTPYPERTMEDCGSWLVINASGWSNMLTGANSEFLLERYREFLASVRAHRTCADDEGMSLATYALRAVEDVQSCLHFARKNNLSIALRLIPPPP